MLAEILLYWGEVALSRGAVLQDCVPETFLDFKDMSPFVNSSTASSLQLHRSTFWKPIVAETAPNLLRKFEVTDDVLERMKVRVNREWQEFVVRDLNKAKALHRFEKMERLRYQAEAGSLVLDLQEAHSECKVVWQLANEPIVPMNVEPLLSDTMKVR